ncbi:MAG: ATP-binding protein [Candidatus Nitrosopolaris sp.]
MAVVTVFRKNPVVIVPLRWVPLIWDSKCLMVCHHSTNRILDVLEEKRPKIICIDELDKMPRQFQDNLLNFMGSGHIKVDQMRKHYDFRIKGAKVFAACNEITRLSKPLRSRFRCLHLPRPTTPEPTIYVGNLKSNTVTVIRTSIAGFPGVSMTNISGFIEPRAVVVTEHDQMYVLNSNGSISMLYTPEFNVGPNLPSDNYYSGTLYVENEKRVIVTEPGALRVINDVTHNMTKVPLPGTMLAPAGIASDANSVYVSGCCKASDSVFMKDGIRMYVAVVPAYNTDPVRLAVGNM